MNREEILYLAPYIFSLLLSFGIFAYTWRHRQVRGARIYSWFISGQALTILGFIFELISPTLTIKIFWDKFQWLTDSFLVFIPFLIFSIQFSEHKLRHPRLTWGIWLAIPILFTALLLTDNLHHLIYPDPHLSTDYPFPDLEYRFTFVVYLYALAYAYGVNFYGIFLLMRRAAQPYNLYRFQFLTIAIGFLIPLVLSFFTLANIKITPQRDIFPFSSALGNLVVAWGLFRYGLFDIVPIARERIVENITDPVVVLDTRNRVVDMNSAALKALGKQNSQVAGISSAEAFKNWPVIANELEFLDVKQKEIAVRIDNDTFFYDLNISAIYSNSGPLVGRVIVARDVTRHKTLEAGYRILSQELDQRVRERTEELHNIAERYRAVVENQTEFIVRWKADGTRTFVNEAYSRYFGISVEQALLTSFAPSIVEEDRRAVEEKLSRLIAGETDSEKDIHRVIKPDGSIGWQEWIDQAIRDANGQIIEFQSVGRDVTERMQAQETILKQLAFDELITGFLTDFATRPYDEMDTSINNALQKIAQFFGGNLAEILLLSDDKTIWASSHSWIDPQIAASVHPTDTIQAGPLAWSENEIFSGRPIRINSLDDYPPEALTDRQFGEAEGIKSILSIPIRGRESFVFGVLDLVSYVVEATWSDSDVTHLKIVGDAIANVLERKRAEETLRESEAIYRKAIEVAGAVPYRQTYGEGFITNYDFIGEGIRELTGYGPEEFNEQVWDALVQETNLLGELTQYSWREAILRVRTGASPIWQCEQRIHTRDGKTRWVYEAAVELRNKDGISHGSIGLFQDITERKKAEAALRNSEERFSKAFQQSPVIITISQVSDSKLLEANGAFEKIFGYTREEALGKTMAELGVWANWADRERLIPIMIANGRIRNEEVRYRAKSGEIHTCLLSAELIELDNKKCILAVIEDITDRKDAELALRNSEERFSKAFQASPIIITISQINNGKLLEVNDTFEKIMGFSREEVIGKTAAELSLWTNLADRERIMKAFRTNGKLKNEELQFRTKNGNLITCYYSAELIEIGGEACLLAIVEDITERKKAEARILRLNRLYATISQINQTIVHARDKDSLFREICRVAIDDGQFRMAWIGLIDENDKEVKPVIFAGEELGYLEKLGTINYHDEIKGNGPTGTAIREGRCIICQDIATDPRMTPWRESALSRGYLSSAAVPIREQGKVVGALTVYADEVNGFDAENEGLLEQIGQDVSFALDSIQAEVKRKRAEENLEEAYDTTLEGWANALELRDKETEGHSRRVTETTLVVAKAMGFSDAELIHIRRGSILHDIGKMGIPDQILRKAGPLTDEERQIVLKHPATAYNLLKQISYLEKALEIPYCHHEKWDGSGYPRGLKGEEIPLPARIFAIVDVWDALSSDRPYREAWSREKVVNYLRNEIGSHFDPRVASVFLTLVEKGEI